MSDNAAKVNTSKFVCKSCGGNMEFDPESQSLKCPFCSDKTPIEKNEEKPSVHDYRKADTEASRNWGEEKRLIKCESCGAETMIDSAKSADFCAFCGSSHILNQEDTNPAIAPETVIPFKISKNQATEAFKQWIAKKKFAPNALKSRHTMESISGVYMPFWSYNSKTESDYTAEKGTYYYTSEMKTFTDSDGKVQTRQEQVRHTRWENVAGNYIESFEDVNIVASDNVSQILAKEIEPYKLEELTKYDPRYISGFLAERYTVDIHQGWNMAKNEIDENIASGIIEEIGGDEHRNLNVKTDYKTIDYKLMMLPMWISSYRFKDKVYNFLVNGQTGRVAGKAPTSWAKVLGLFGGIAGVAAIIILLVKLFGH